MLSHKSGEQREPGPILWATMRAEAEEAEEARLKAARPSDAAPIIAAMLAEAEAAGPDSDSEWPSKSLASTPGIKGMAGWRSARDGARSLLAAARGGIDAGAPSAKDMLKKTFQDVVASRPRRAGDDSRAASRPPLPPPEPVDVRSAAQGLGIDISANNEVLGLVPGGQAEADGVQLFLGDKVVGIDGQLLGTRRLREVMQPGKPRYTLLIRRIEAVNAARAAHEAAAQLAAQRPSARRSPFAAANESLDAALVNAMLGPPLTGSDQATVVTGLPPLLPSFVVPLCEDYGYAAWPAPTEPSAAPIPTPSSKGRVRVRPNAAAQSLSYSAWGVTSV
eukprot:jgi/Chrpa1/13795/Chrysochromulina_OHIO_Genome00002664-RA